MDDDFRERLAGVWDTTRISLVLLFIVLAMIGWADIILHFLQWLFG